LLGIILGNNRTSLPSKMLCSVSVAY
jgi:hypothetical protein